ncbi:hypothetical protein J6590_042757 [Homalodisca vitripennis]|nr:hypothetical protein J6590_042757 [Homalodisca vitripennis]
MYVRDNPPCNGLLPLSLMSCSAEELPVPVGVVGGRGSVISSRGCLGLLYEHSLLEYPFVVWTDGVDLLDMQSYCKLNLEIQDVPVRLPRVVEEDNMQAMKVHAQRVSGMICVQSLYSNWREEKEVLRRLRDLNMTRVIPNRRNSVSSQGNGYIKSPLVAPVAYTPPPQLLNNGAFVSPLRRSGSMVSVVSRPPNSSMMMAPPPLPLPLHPFLAADPAMRVSEFNASQFDLSLTSSLQSFSGLQMNKSYSMMDLRSVGSGGGSDTPRKTASVIDFPVEKKTPTHTQSLDRRILKLPAYGRPIPPQIEGFYVSGRLKSAYFPPFRSGDFPVDPNLQFVQGSDLIYRQNMNAFYPSKPNSRSKYSLGSDSDDFQKYRDIAL